MLVENRQTKVVLDIKATELCLENFLMQLKMQDWDIALIFVDSAESASLNQQYRNKVGAANVLSFPAQEFLPGEKPRPDEDGLQDLGDIIICPEKVASDALEWGIEFQENLERMMAHGLLHLLGYDHQTDTEHATMTAMEEWLIGKKILE